MERLANIRGWQGSKHTCKVALALAQYWSPCSCSVLQLTQFQSQKARVLLSAFLFVLIVFMATVSQSCVSYWQESEGFPIFKNKPDDVLQNPQGPSTSDYAALCTVGDSCTT
jgi:hypothetical protein